MPDKLKGVVVVATAIGLSVCIWFLIIGCVSLFRKFRQKSKPHSVGVGIKIAALFPAYIPLILAFPLALEWLGLTTIFDTLLTGVATAIPPFISGIILVTVSGLISTAVWFLFVGSSLLIKKLFQKNDPLKVGMKSKLFAILPAVLPLLLVLPQVLDLRGYPPIAGPIVDSFLAFVPNIVAAIILCLIGGLIATAVWWATFSLIYLFQKMTSVETKPLARLIRKGFAWILGLFPLWVIVPQAIMTSGIPSSKVPNLLPVGILGSLFVFTALFCRHCYTAGRTNRVDSANQ